MVLLACVEDRQLTAPDGANVFDVEEVLDGYLGFLLVITWGS